MEKEKEKEKDIAIKNEISNKAEKEDKYKDVGVDIKDKNN